MTLNILVKLLFKPTFYQVSVLKLFFEGLLLLHFPRLQRRYGRKSFSTLYIAFLLFYGLNGLTFFPTCYKIHSSFFLIRIEGERGRKRENIIWHRVWHYFSDNIESTYYNREFSLAYTNIYPLFLFHLCTRHDILFENESFI